MYGNIVCFLIILILLSAFGCDDDRWSRSRVEEIKMEQAIVARLSEALRSSNGDIDSARLKLTPAELEETVRRFVFFDPAIRLGTVDDVVAALKISELGARWTYVIDHAGEVSELMLDTDEIAKHSLRLVSDQN